MALRYAPGVEREVCILGIPDSPVGPAVALRLAARGIAAHTLALDAPLTGEAVTVGPDHVVWQGHDLTGAGAVLVERLVFPWPQPQRINDLLRDGAPDPVRVNAEREARSLLVSALAAAAEHVSVINRPSAAHAAASPAVALDRLARAGLPVHSWRLAPISPETPPGPLRDAAGPEYWHRHRSPRSGEPAILFAGVDGEIASVLIVGEKAASVLRFADASSWEEDRSPAVVPPDKIPYDLAAVAAEAATHLGLHFAAVSLTAARRRPRVLWVEAGPDLDLWHTRTNGATSAALADYIVSVPVCDEGVHQG